MEVTVLLTTYNHEKYIAQALDSVLMQETNFDFELVILEDCSTDSTRDIVLAYQKKHPRKIRLRLAKRNVHSNKPFAEEFQAAPSPYIAMLDGDDYWSSPAKLQKQVEFLKVHPDYMLCFHNALRVYEDEDRAPLLHNLADWFYNLPYGDWPLYSLCAQHGKIGYIDEIFGVYRIHSGGVWSRLDPIQKLEGLIAFYQTMNANLNFRFNHIVEPLVTARRKELAIARSLVKIGRRTLPPGGVVIVMSKAYDDLPSLEGHQVWAFPDRSGRQTQRHFASGSAGSAEAPWIGAGGVYEFRLYGGATQNKLLASVTVIQNTTGFYPPLPGAEARKYGAFIEASPNPVPTGTKSGKTTITWSTGDGSQGLIHVAIKSLQMHYPADGGEAIKQLKALRVKGGEFLLIPCEHFSWLEEYVGLKEHLDSHYALIQDDEICRIYDLRAMPSQPASTS